MHSSVRLKLLVVALSASATMNCYADVSLVGFGSISGTYADLSDATAGVLATGLDLRQHDRIRPLQLLRLPRLRLLPPLLRPLLALSFTRVPPRSPGTF